LLLGPVDEAPGTEIGDLAPPLLLDQLSIVRHGVECLANRFQRNLKVLGEFLGCVRIRPRNVLVDHRDPDPPALDP
jgi:hypothetical protein